MIVVVVSYDFFFFTVLLWPPRQLANGVRVATEAGAGPVASLTVSVDMGSRYETPENNGVCSVIGQSAFHVSLQYENTVLPPPQCYENLRRNIFAQSVVYPQVTLLARS